MLKFQFTLIMILLSCVVLISCEKATDVINPGMPGIGNGDTDDMQPPDGMEEPVNEGAAVVINELMADNDNVIMDPQGDFDDWLELYNSTDSSMDLSGMYLSDKEDNPTKWQFPVGTMIQANGYLIVWLDEDHNDETATEGLHANFKLSKGGETVMLVGPDAEGNMVLDSVTFGDQETDISYGRLPNGTGEFQTVSATPGAVNEAE
ncbi:lamin tail domain-containing protein [Candidatus Poribacteria bacterium]|nr:lamin tail domain-containing protein [Candidatus Poribacteria bacterium]